MEKLFPHKPNYVYYWSAVGLSLVLGLFYWFSETLLDVYVFHIGSFSARLFPVDENEFWMRCIGLSLLLFCGLSAVYFFAQKASVLITSKLIHQILSSLRAAVMITDHDNKIIFINQCYTEITGYSWDDVVGKNPNVLSAGIQDKAFYKQLWVTLNSTGSWEGEVWNRKKSGELFAEWINISIVKDRKGHLLYYVGIFSDISIRKEQEKQIMHYAYYDVLTNLQNRRLYVEQLKQAIALSKRNQQNLAVVFIDLDDFKEVNDQFGHVIGDAYLCQVASLMKSHLRESDVVARFGGDEFVLLLVNMPSKEAALKFSQELSSKLEAAMIQIEDKTFLVKASLGCAVYPDDGLDAESLIQIADAHMYEVKTQRKAMLIGVKKPPRRKH